MRQKGTERPGSHPFDKKDPKDQGVYSKLLPPAPTGKANRKPALDVMPLYTNPIRSCKLPSNAQIRADKSVHPDADGPLSSILSQEQSTDTKIDQCS